MALIPMTTLDNDIPISEASTEEERLQLQINSYLTVSISLNSNLILSQLFYRLQQKGLDAAGLLDYFDEWGLIDEDNLVLIGIGLERYFARDYASALHILVPQYEDIVRTLFDRAGYPVIRQRNKVKGWEIEPFGTFLSHKFVEDALGNNLLEYIRLVLTEPTGWNLRNLIAHGLLSPGSCTRLEADTVLHLYLILTIFDIEKRPAAVTSEVTDVNCSNN
jgi:hypothetical protein